MENKGDDNPVKPVLDQLDVIIKDVEAALVVNKSDKKETTVTEPMNKNITALENGTAPAPATVTTTTSTETVQKKKCGVTGKKDKKNKMKGSKPEKAPTLPIETTQWLQCDLRVGCVSTVGTHPEASGLYILNVGYGEGEAERTVCAGLRNFLSEDELKGRQVVTICNLKPRKLRGVESQAMILAGSVVSDDEEKGKEKVVPIAPPTSAKIGAIVRVENIPSDLPRTVEDGKFVSSKTWDKIVPRLSVKDGAATYNGSKLIVESHAVLCDLPDGSEIH